jgi:hypothetical protein
MNNNYNNIGEGLAKQYKSALFIDNAQDHILQMQSSCNRGMTVLKVDESPSLRPIPYDHPLMISYANMIGLDNTYLITTRKISQAGYLDPVSGIQLKHVPFIEQWINLTSKHAPRAILFDWDRTITMIEGVHVNKDGMAGLKNEMKQKYGIDLPDITIEDTLLYLCGGRERLTLLRIIMSECIRLKIDVIFLTNNGGCTSEGVNGLREIMDGLFPPGAHYDVICSRPAPYLGDKGKAFREEMPDKSSLICLSGFNGGMRGKKNRRNKTHKQSSKRRNKTKYSSRKSYK